MSTNAYFNSHFDPDTNLIEIGVCKCKPSHPVFAELRFPDKPIVVSCEAHNPLIWKQVSSAVDEFKDLDGPVTAGKKALPNKRSINEFLRLCYGRYLANLPEPVETAVMIIQTQEGLGHQEPHAGSDTPEDDTADEAVLPAEVESPPGTPTVGHMTVFKPLKAAPTLPIWYYNATTDVVTLFNMCHISRTALIYGGILAIDTVALYTAIHSGNGRSIWNVVTDTLGHIMPASLSGAAETLQVALGDEVSRGLVPAPRNLGFTVPASVMSEAANRLRAMAINDSTACGPSSRRGNVQEISEDDSSQASEKGGQEGKGKGKGKGKGRTK